MVTIALDETDKTPMWTGWNSTGIEEEQFRQQVWYLPQINASPTSQRHHNEEIIGDSRRDWTKFYQ